MKKNISFIFGLVAISSVTLALPVYAQVIGASGGVGLNLQANYGNHNGGRVSVDSDVQNQIHDNDDTYGDMHGREGLTIGVDSDSDIDAVATTTQYKDYGDGRASSTSMFSGNGEPVVAGKVTAIASSTISITNNSNVTYTIDVSNAKILADQNATTSLKNISVGDTVVVQGEVSGTNVTAATVLDQTTQVNASTTKNEGMLNDFFSGIGQFFMHLFGF